MDNNFFSDFIQKLNLKGWSYNWPKNQFTNDELKTILGGLNRCIEILQSDFDVISNATWDHQYEKESLLQKTDEILEIIYCIETSWYTWFYIDKLSEIKMALWTVIYRDNNHELDNIFERVTAELAESIKFVQGIN